MLHSLLIPALAAALSGAAAEQAAGEIEVSSVLVKLIEQVDVPAGEAGVLETVDVREGRMVAEGDRLAQLVDSEARIAAERAKIELAIAEKNVANDVHVRFAEKSVEVANAELKRSLDSIQEYPKSISDSEMDRLRLVVERAVLEAEQAEYDLAIAAFTRQIRENELQAAEQQVQRRRITAPTAGVVVDVHRRRGEWVEPGDAVVRILRMDRLRAEGFLAVKALRGDLAGCRVRLIVDLPERPQAEFAGELVFVSPEIDPLNAQVRVLAEIDNHELLLRPGMRARMIVELPAPKDASVEPRPPDAGDTHRPAAATSPD